MKYFDIAQFKVDPKLAERLGYARLFSPDEIALTSVPRSSGTQYLLQSEDPGHLYKALKDRNCIGIAITSNTLIKKTLEQVRLSEKLLFFIASEFTNADNASLLRNLSRARLLYKFVLKEHVQMAIVSMAADATGLLSSAQLVAVAKLIGADEVRAKAMASALGEHYDH